eukprot:2123834-Rhodomonas_salina.3
MLKAAVAYTPNIAADKRASLNVAHQVRQLSCYMDSAVAARVSDSHAAVDGWCCVADGAVRMDAETRALHRCGL